jgi:hypothetical protein
MTVQVMKSFEAIPVLNQMLQVLCRSLPMYLADARPWARPEHESLQMALEQLVGDRRQYAERVAKAILQLGGRPDPGRFPSEFAAKNDLSLDFMLHEVIDAQDEDVSRLDHCASQLAGMPLLHALAQEIYGNACGHLEILREAARNPS